MLKDAAKGQEETGAHWNPFEDEGDSVQVVDTGLWRRRRVNQRAMDEQRHQQSLRLTRTRGGSGQDLP